MSRAFVEFRELCRYAQKDKGDFMFYDKYMVLCKQKGVSPSRAAEEAGFAKSLVTKWRTNQVEIPSSDILAKLSNYFHIPVSELLGEEKEKTPSELALTEGEMAMLSLFRQIPKDRQPEALDLLRVALKMQQKP